MSATIIAAQVVVAPPAPQPGPRVAARAAPSELHGAAIELLDTQAGLSVALLRPGQPPLVQRLTVPIALMLLADRRVAELWPALLDLGGADLTLLRNHEVARARTLFEADTGSAMPRSTIESSVRPRTRAVLQFASALAAAGRTEEARELVERERSMLDRTSDWGRAEWVMLTVRLSTLALGADRSAAIQILAAARAEAGPDDPYALNFDVNRAAYLAEDGHYAEAMVAITDAEGRFDAQRSGKPFGPNAKVPGSSRQFAWIRACALAGLGRAAEARRMLAPVLAAREPRDRSFVLPSNDDIGWRAYRCMDDSAAAARLLAEEAADVAVGGTAMTLLQPGLHGVGRDASFAAKVRAEPVLAPVLARMRTLPAVLTPALNGWRD